MAVVRRATDKDAVWARAWTADTFADLATITDFTWNPGPRHGDVAYVTDEALYYVWRDDDTWQAAGASGSSWIPLVDGSEPPVFITDTLGHLILVAYP